MTTKILITGACGFIGHHIVEHILKHTDWDIVILDKLSYASSGFDRLRDIEVFSTNESRVKVFTTDFTCPIEEGLLDEIGQVEYILHMGAESHVDNSITDPMKFVYSNVIGTGNMLQFARQQKNLKKFIYFSTDEVFGPAYGAREYGEWDRYCSSNPYAASKAGGEELAIAFANTYKLPVMITHTMNVFGERQHNEKFIPIVVKKILADEEIQIHSDSSRTKAGSRYWIHARNVAAAIMFLINMNDEKDFEIQLSGKTDDEGVPTFERHQLPVTKWNIVGEKETDNLELAQLIHKSLSSQGLTKGPLKYKMVDFHSSRPGHDLRYGLSGEKLKKVGHNLPVGFEESLDRTIKWMVDPKWVSWLSKGTSGPPPGNILSPIQRL